MSEPSRNRRPRVRLLTDELIVRVIEEAKEILERVGVKIHAGEGLELLGNAGAKIVRAEQRAFIPPKLVDEALKTVPSSVTLYDRSGKPKVILEGDNVYFQPTSSTIKVWDSDIEQLRDPVSQDLVDFTKVTDALDNLAIQSSNYYPVDVAAEVASCYRKFICLQNSPKPIFGSIIPTRANLDTLMELLIAVRGKEQALQEKPLLCAVVPTLSPLRWLSENYYLLTQFAKRGVPSIVAVAPAMGVSGPITVIGCVTQLIAEFFSGVVITQLTHPGAPVLVGNYIEFFDMRLGTTCMGTMVNYMADMAGVEVVSYLDIPSLVFMGCSDAKRLDSQSGLESGIGFVLGALCGANIVQSAGGLSDVIPTSLEKLVIDNEICGMAYRLLRGISSSGEKLAEDLYTKGLLDGDHFLLSLNTINWLREEGGYSGKVLDRESIESWQEMGSTTAEQRAREEVKKILATHEPEALDPNTDKELVDIMTRYAKKHGMDKLPVK